MAISTVSRLSRSREVIFQQKQAQNKKEACGLRHCKEPQHPVTEMTKFKMDKGCTPIRLSTKELSVNTLARRDASGNIQNNFWETLPQTAARPHSEAATHKKNKTHFPLLAAIDCCSTIRLKLNRGLWTLASRDRVTPHATYRKRLVLAVFCTAYTRSSINSSINGIIETIFFFIITCLHYRALLASKHNSQIEWRRRPKPGASPPCPVAQKTPPTIA